MKEVLRSGRLPPERNVFIYHALGKEYEDLEEWEEAFRYYRMGGDAVAAVANYDVNTDLQIIDRIINVCNADWLAAGPKMSSGKFSGKTPIFVVGLPLEEACLEFHRNITPSNTASAVQVRERMHCRSVNRWQQFARHLKPLRLYLENAGMMLA